MPMETVYSTGGKASYFGVLNVLKIKYYFMLSVLRRLYVWCQVPRTGISPTVTSLDLSDNQLTMLTSGSLVALRNVVRLKLDNNEIERILDGAFELTPSLQNLHLSRNNLRAVSKLYYILIIKAAGT